MNGNCEWKALHLYDLLPEKWSGILIQVGLFGNTFWTDKFKHNYDTKLEKLTEWSDVTIWLIYNCAKLFVANCWDWSSGIIRVPSDGKSLSDTLRKQIRLFSWKFFSWNVSRQMWRKTSHLDLMAILLSLIRRLTAVLDHENHGGSIRTWWRPFPLAIGCR